jgi:hypothetical protein
MVIEKTLHKNIYFVNKEFCAFFISETAFAIKKRARSAEGIPLVRREKAECIPMRRGMFLSIKGRYGQRSQVGRGDGP